MIKRVILALTKPFRWYFKIVKDNIEWEARLRAEYEEFKKRS